MARRKPEDPLVTEKKTSVMALTDSFCETRLNAEYKKLTRKLLEAMAKETPSPLLRGKPEIWAAGIVHAIGGANFLFDKSTKPYVSAIDLAAAFGVSPATASQKASGLRDRYPIDFPNTDYAAQQVRGIAQNMMDMLAQTGLFMQGENGNFQVGVASSGGTMLADEFRLPPRRPSRQSEEFLDVDRPVMRVFYDLTEHYEQAAPQQKPRLINELKELIDADPDFYDTYLMLADILDEQEGGAQKAAALRETAFRRALARLPDKKGNWPKSVPWGYLENRHLIRALDDGATQLWNAGEAEAALDIYRKLLKSNPNDNIGARNYILAIRLGQTLEEHEALFEREDGMLDARKMYEWFDKESAAFADEFAEWKKRVDEENAQ